MSLYRSSGHDINPSFTNFVGKKWPGNHMGLLRYKAVIPGLCSSSNNTFYIIWRIILRRLSKCCSIYNKDQSIFFTNKPSRMVEIIGFRNDTIHEPIPDHQLFLWQNAFLYLYILDHQRVNISLGLMLERFHTGDDQRWIIVRSEALWNAGSCHLALFHSLWSWRSYTNIANRE